MHNSIECLLNIHDIQVFATQTYDLFFTWDIHHSFDDRVRARKGLEELGLLPVTETGARFYLDSRRKHHPTLLSLTHEERLRRSAFLTRCGKTAQELGAPCMSLWSGRDEGGDNWAFLEERLRLLCATADHHGVDLAFEPEPGMFIDTMGRFDELVLRVAHPRLKLTLDVGHVHCLEDEPPEEVIRRYADKLVNVHLDDHRKGVHEHLMFGEGEIDFGPVMEALKEVAQDRDLPATVELSRHSHNAVETARKSFEFLSGLL